jgi:16S rRNA C967 or C1407 C5-methylase (RsmB/RsmF family)/NOL1/NOP2/fmu family ribosome biogenesis protein
MENRIPLPKDFVDRVSNDPFLGEPLLEALETVAPTSIRVHPVKGKHHFTETVSIPWSKNGLWLKERPLFTLDPFFHAGCYYPQEAGSQLLTFVLGELDLPENPVCLDLCAAPGGKSSLILDHLAGKGLLVSNEIITSRARILYENLTKWGYHNSVICNNASDAFGKMSNFFDLMVVDAPCSGEGMFRKDPESRNEWSEANVEMCAERHKDIIENIWDGLKQNGLLIYSTCTFNEDENEKNIEWIRSEFGAEIVEINYPKEFKPRNGIGAYALPGKVNTEGFFICVLRKTNAGSSKKTKSKTKPFQELKSGKELSQYIKEDPLTKVIDWKDKAWLIPVEFAEEMQQISSSLNVFKLGLPVAEPTRKGWIPDEAIPFSAFLSDSIKRINLDKKEALLYLKGETFSIEPALSADRPGNGYAVVCYENIPLGWIKMIGNRFNNNYPKEWRIRMKID